MTIAEQYVQNLLKTDNKKSKKGVGHNVRPSLADKEEPQDELVEALMGEKKVEDASPDNMTLEEHDRRHHPEGYKEGDTCKFREKVATVTETDKADNLDKDKAITVSSIEKEEPVKALSPEEEMDAAYLNAIENGDMKTADKLVREAAKQAGYDIQAYHGTNTGAFTVFDKNRANVESDMGAGFYLTSNEDDVTQNYEGGGPDFDNKIARLAERIQSEEDIEDYDEAKEIAEKRLMGENGGAHLITGYVKMDNPAHVNGTTLFADILDDISEEDYDDEDDYYQAQEDAIAESLNDIQETLDELGYYNIEEVMPILNDAVYNGGISIPDLKEQINNLYIEDDEGNQAGNEVLRAIIESLGYDGIIDDTVSEKFKNMGLDEDTTHYIVFNPNQIKSAETITRDEDGNVIPLSKRFKEEEDDIRYSKEFGEGFWEDTYGEGKKSYSERYKGANKEEIAEKAQETYKETFTKGGKYKSPWKDGKLSKELMDKVSSLGSGWNAKDREEAEAAAKVLENVLPGVKVTFSEKPFAGEADTRKSISGIGEKEDAAYLEAVNKGDMDTAMKMVREAAAKAMPDTKVVGEDGLPLVVYHGGTFGFDRNTIANGLVHFGTLQAAADRFTDIGQLGAVEREDGWHLTDSFDNTESKEVYPSREAAMMSRLKDSVKGYFLNIRNPAQTEDRISDPEFDEENGIDSLIAQEKHEGYDGNIYLNNVEDAGSTSWVAYSPNQIKSADPVTYNDEGEVIPLSERFNSDSNDIRYFKDSANKVVGEYDRKTGTITLYPRAKVKDVVHEYAHGIWQFAEQEAKAGRKGLLDNLKKVAKAAPEGVKKAIGKAYADQGPGVIMEECFTHELANKSEQNQEFAKAIKTASGKVWYRKAWGAIKNTWKGFTQKLGIGNKVDTSKLDSMSPAETAQYILSQMAQGKQFGDINPTPDGSGKRKSISGIYTGSSADYDKPSLLKVGTGDGGQIYGWGLYGSNERGEAETYADMEVGKYEYSYQKNGKIINEKDDTIESKAVGALKLWGDVETAIEELKGIPNSEAIIKELKEHGSEYQEYNPQKHIYEQTFFTNRPEGDESHLLKWYSSERPRTLLKTIRSNLTEEQANTFNKMYNKAYRSGPGGSAQAVFNQDIYEMLTDILGSPKEATEFLRDKCDIDGIKYPVNSYSGPIRDGDKEGWNYVSFRDDNIRVDHKWEDGEQKY